jgi:hypothetical protein
VADESGAQASAGVIVWASPVERDLVEQRTALPGHAVPDDAATISIGWMMSTIAA